MNHSSQILNQIIESHRSTNDKYGIGYKAAVTNACSSSGVEKTGTERNNEKSVDKKTKFER